MSMVTIDKEELKAIHDKLDTLTAMLKNQSALNGLSKYMDEAETVQVTHLKKDALRLYRRWGVFTKKMIGGKRMYIRKEIEAYLDGKLAPKVYAMREGMKEQKQSKATA